jgi:hypothetical protein
MAKVVRHRRFTTYDEAFRRAFKCRCWQAGVTPKEIQWWSFFNTDAKAILLSLIEMSEKDALPYKRVQTPGGV